MIDMFAVSEYNSQAMAGFERSSPHRDPDDAQHFALGALQERPALHQEQADQNYRGYREDGLAPFLSGIFHR